MANPEHVKVVRQGKGAIDEWRRAHPGQGLDLSGITLYEAKLPKANLRRANFRGTDLRGANLRGADLGEANLRGADLSEADLRGADLGRANLTDANFGRADLSGADLSRAYFLAAILSETDLSKANLHYANFWGANLTWANLTGANLTGADLYQTVFRNTIVLEANFGSAVLGGTVFANCDLSDAINLGTVLHNFPSTIGIDTILRSSGNIPEEFLRGAGVPEEIIRGLPRLIGEIQYHSCFIAYGEPDKTFAEQLHKDFTAKGVNSWLYSTDSTPGKRTWGEIGQRRREAGKFIVICSAAALVRDGLLKEIEEQMDEDPEKIIPISRDKLWKEPGFKVTRGTRDLKPFLMERNYANFEEGSDYKKELNRLLKALERKKT